MPETVAGLSLLRRATSAREMGPSVLTRLTTRLVFKSRIKSRLAFGINSFSD